LEPPTSILSTRLYKFLQLFRCGNAFQILISGLRVVYAAEFGSPGDWQIHNYIWWQGLLESHCTEYMGHHLLETLQYVQNHEVALGGHAQRILLVEKVNREQVVGSQATQGLELTLEASRVS
jgi:hypothetical protein